VFAGVFHLSLSGPSQFAKMLFMRPVGLLQGFLRVGIGYDFASLLIRVWLPLLVFLVLFAFAFPTWCRGHLPTVSRMAPWLRRA
jgi:hypothetical protein